MLVNAFNDHPHVVVSPITKDTLLIKNEDGKYVPDRTILTQVGLGTILSDIVCDNPTIKNKVGERAFHYIICRLGCVCRFTEWYKSMCGGRECVGIQTLHSLLQVNVGK